MSRTEVTSDAPGCPGAIGTGVRAASARSGVVAVDAENVTVASAP
jgi:hypothetical protein